MFAIVCTFCSTCAYMFHVLLLLFSVFKTATNIIHYTFSLMSKYFKFSIPYYSLRYVVKNVLCESLVFWSDGITYTRNRNSIYINMTNVFSGISSEFKFLRLICSTEYILMCEKNDNKYLLELHNKAIGFKWSTIYKHEILSIHLFIHTPCFVHCFFFDSPIFSYFLPPTLSVCFKIQTEFKRKKKKTMWCVKTKMSVILCI